MSGASSDGEGGRQLTKRVEWESRVRREGGEGELMPACRRLAKCFHLAAFKIKFYKNKCGAAQANATKHDSQDR